MQLEPTGSGPTSPLFPAPITVVRMRTALTRGVSPSIGQCELTYLKRQPIDFEVALSQHKRYEQVLEDLGCRIERLVEEPNFPDSVFVEDIAIVLDEFAIITRPGATSRRGERESIERALRPHRRLEHIQAPAILDGGDVLVVGKDIYVGISSRSNSEAVDQVRAIVTDYGYTVGEVNGSYRPHRRHRHHQPRLGCRRSLPGTYLHSSRPVRAERRQRPAGRRHDPLRSRLPTNR